MHSPRTILTLAAVTVLALGASLTACSSTKASAETPAYLFVFDGFDGTMTAVAGRPDTYTFVADLNCDVIADCSPVAWFTDRPVRDSGTLDITSFVALWSDAKNDGFRVDPPNVAIEVPGRDTASGLPETIIAEMSQPALHTDPTTGVWISATMAIIPSEQLDDPAMAGSHLGGHTDTVRSDVPNVVGDVTVFVDDAGAWSANASTTSNCEKSCGPGSTVTKATGSTPQAHPQPSTAVAQASPRPTAPPAEQAVAPPAEPDK